MRTRKSTWFWRTKEASKRVKKGDKGEERVMKDGKDKKI